jgi:cation diffusion facilitator CzcD-associated flavoprotein CzcO
MLRASPRRRFIPASHQRSSCFAQSCAGKSNGFLRQRRAVHIPFGSNSKTSSWLTPITCWRSVSAAMSSDAYYPTFNQPNVELIDVSATKGVERMTARGFVHNGVEYEIDCLINATGFEVTSDLTVVGALPRS